MVTELQLFESKKHKNIVNGNKKREITINCILISI
jgi:hypothetical protein